MSMKRTPAWYEQYQRKQATAIGKANAEVAAAWNGNTVDTGKLGNVEFVTVTSGGETGTGRPSPRQKAIAQSPRMTVAVGNDTARTLNQSLGPLTLPWPPSGNTAVRHAKGVHYLRPEVTTYRQAVAVILGRSTPISGRYELVIELSPPDARRRDIDNALKSLLDACVHAGWLPDDSMAYMRKLTVTVNDDRRGEVSIRALTDREAA